MLRGLGHNAWTAYEAGLPQALDEVLIAYAASKAAIAVTTNKDFGALARRLRMAKVVLLRVDEARAAEAMRRAVDWLANQALPDGMVLRVPLNGPIMILSPQPIADR
jgi:predicted nuclease of predicted toxin-antitoxin system